MSIGNLSCEEFRNSLTDLKTFGLLVLELAAGAYKTIKNDVEVDKLIFDSINWIVTKLMFISLGCRKICPSLEIVKEFFFSTKGQ